MTLQESEILPRLELLITLGRSLHEAGLPAHRLEEALVRTAERFSVPAQVFSMPTGLMISVDAPRGPMTSIVRVEATGVQLERLARLSAITRRIAAGELNASQAKAAIDQVTQAPPRWGRPAIVLAYVLSAASFSIFFGGAWPELLTATGIGLVVGLLTIGFGRLPVSRRLFELTASIAAALISTMAYAVFGLFVEWIPLASGLIILLPGLAMVDALEELSHGHLSSGGARLAGVGVVLLGMTFGAALGLVIADPFFAEPSPATTVPLPEWNVLPALAAIAVGSTIRFRGRPQDCWAALAASTIALTGSRLGAASLGEVAGPFLSAFVLGLSANLFARVTRQPLELFTVPGLALLVPGSFGVRSMSALLSEQTTLSVDMAFHMFLTAMALVTGLLFSTALSREE